MSGSLTPWCSMRAGWVPPRTWARQVEAAVPQPIPLKQQHAPGPRRRRPLLGPCTPILCAARRSGRPPLRWPAPARLGAASGGGAGRGWGLCCGHRRGRSVQVAPIGLPCERRQQARRGLAHRMQRAALAVPDANHIRRACGASPRRDKVCAVTL